MRKKERIEVLERKLEALLDYFQLVVSKYYDTFEISKKPEPESEPKPEPEPEPELDPAFMTDRAIRMLLSELESRGLMLKPERDFHSKLSAELLKRNRRPIEPPQRKGKIF